MHAVGTKVTEWQRGQGPEHDGLLGSLYFVWNEMEEKSTTQKYQANGLLYYNRLIHIIFFGRLVG